MSSPTHALRYFLNLPSQTNVTYGLIVDGPNKTGEFKNRIGSGDLMKVLTTLLGVENKPTKAEVNLFIWVTYRFKLLLRKLMMI